MGELTKLKISINKAKIGDCIVIVPTYNERENIAALIESLRNLDESMDILIVDDNSPDGTANIVQSMMERFEGIHLLQRAEKQGLGCAYKAGFQYALQGKWDYICQIDADFSHNPKDIPRLLHLCRAETDIAIGSRYVDGGKIVGWPRRRWLLSWAANRTAKTMLKTQIRDMTGGFKCFTRNALEQILGFDVTSEGYIFQVEMNYLAQKLNLRIQEYPICFTERQSGISKMGIHEAHHGFLQLIRLATKKS